MNNTTVGDLYDRCVTSFGDATAARYADRSYTYREVGDQAHRLANALHELGLKKGDKVTLRAIYRTRSGCLSMFDRARQAFWKRENTRGTPEHRHVPQCLGAILQQPIRGSDGRLPWSSQEGCAEQLP